MHGFGHDGCNRRAGRLGLWLPFWYLPRSREVEGIAMKKIALATTLALCALSAAPAYTQSYPVKPVRLIAPFPPGGSSDLVARLVGQKLSEDMGQQFVVDNRPGAGGTLGTELGARAPADGYAVLIGNISAFSVNPHLFRKLPYDSLKDFTYISMLAVGTTVLVVHPSLPAKNVKELIALARAKPGALNFGSGGNGTPAHLVGELFKVMAKVNIVHIPYKGTGQSLNDLLGGQIHFVFASTPVGLPHVKNGKLRALAVTGEARTPLAPELPTVAESGLPGFAFDSWWGLNGPAGMPADIVSRLNGRLQVILKQADVKDKLAALGLEPKGSTPQDYQAFVKADLEKVGKLVKAIGLQPE